MNTASYNFYSFPNKNPSSQGSAHWWSEVGLWEARPRKGCEPPLEALGDAFLWRQQHRAPLLLRGYMYVSVYVQVSCPW